MTRVFISYRRTDSPLVARLIRDRLTREFGEGSVYFDIVDAELGRDFVDQINQAITDSVALLAVIGTQWLEILNSRQAAANDHVRAEIESALRQGTPVLPLAVDGAEIPSKGELPKALGKMANQDGMHIRAGHDFDRDIARLIEGLVALGMQPPLPKGPKQARLEHIASVIAPQVESDNVLLPANYDVPIRSLLSDELRKRTGITERTDDSVTLGEVGSESIVWELKAGIEAAFVEASERMLDISLDSSVMSIYSELFDD